MRLFLVTSNKKSLYVLKAAYLNCGLYIVRYANITNKQPSMKVRNSVRRRGEACTRGAESERQAAAIALSVVFISGGCHGKSMLALFRILPQAALASFRTSTLSDDSIYAPTEDALAVKHGQGECQKRRMCGVCNSSQPNCA
jgi:hypothetical protein